MLLSILLVISSLHIYVFCQGFHSSASRFTRSKFGVGQSNTRVRVTRAPGRAHASNWNRENTFKNGEEATDLNGYPDDQSKDDANEYLSSVKYMLSKDKISTSEKELLHQLLNEVILKESFNDLLGGLKPSEQYAIYAAVFEMADNPKYNVNDVIKSLM